jgi:hypothetical protein
MKAGGEKQNNIPLTKHSQKQNRKLGYYNKRTKEHSEANGLSKQNKSKR